MLEKQQGSDHQVELSTLFPVFNFNFNSFSLNAPFYLSGMIIQNWDYLTSCNPVLTKNMKLRCYFHKLSILEFEIKLKQILNLGICSTQNKSISKNTQLAITPTYRCVILLYSCTGQIVALLIMVRNQE
jgi:hypothetical protein